MVFTEIHSLDVIHSMVSLLKMIDTEERLCNL